MKSTHKHDDGPRNFFGEKEDEELLSEEEEFQDIICDASSWETITDGDYDSDSEDSEDAEMREKFYKEVIEIPAVNPLMQDQPSDLAGRQTSHSQLFEKLIPEKGWGDDNPDFEKLEMSNNRQIP